MIFMKHTITLLVAIALGAAAAFANWYFLTVKTKLEYFSAIRVVEEVNIGQPIQEEHLGSTRIYMPNNESPGKTFLPYSEKGLILNRRATRGLVPQDLILRSDIVVEKGPPPEYETLGKFKVIAVGDTFIQSRDGADSGGGDKIVTLEVDLAELTSGADWNTRRLIEILDPVTGQVENSDGFRIVGVVVHPRERQDDPIGNGIEPIPVAPGKVAIFVSLDNMRIVPKVLFIGDEISFLVPKPRFGSVGKNASDGN